MSFFIVVLVDISPKSCNSEAHTYYAGTQETLVHNGGSCDLILAAVIRAAMKEAPLQTQQKAGESLSKVHLIFVTQYSNERIC